MAGRDIERSYNLKRLFDEQLAKVDESKSLEDRHKEAATLMDKLVGSEWRGEIQIPGIKVVEVKILGPKTHTAAPDDAEAFYDRVHRQMKDAGLNFKDEGGLDEHEAKEARKETSLRDRVLSQVTQVINRWLK